MPPAAVRSGVVGMVKAVLPDGTGYISAEGVDSVWFLLRDVEGGPPEVGDSVEFDLCEGGRGYYTRTARVTRKAGREPGCPTVTLGWHEVQYALYIGGMRQIQNLQRGRRDGYGLAQGKDGWQIHIEGACGEAAFAKYINAFWSGQMGNLRAADAGIYQVRTRSEDWYDLIVHPDDPDDAVFVLLTGTAPTFAVRGWILGKDAKRQEWWKDPAGGRPAYFVPQAALRAVEDLLRKE